MPRVSLFVAVLGVLAASADAVAQYHYGPASAQEFQGGYCAWRTVTPCAGGPAFRECCSGCSTNSFGQDACCGWGACSSSASAAVALCGTPANSCEVAETCDGLDNDGDGNTDEDGACDRDPAPRNCTDGDTKCECDPANVGDPINMPSGSAFLRRKDISIATNAGEFSLFRIYSSQDDWWIAGRTADHKALLAEVQVPFGKSPFRAVRTNWWTSLFSFVAEGPTINQVQRVFVRDQIGALHVYNRNGTGAWLSNIPGTGAASGSQSQTLAVRHGINGLPGYQTFAEDGKKLEYGALWTAAGQNKYFLTKIANENLDTVATIAYGTPRATDQTLLSGCTGCGSACGPDKPPYIQTVTLGTGTVLDFFYKRANAAGECGSAGQECVLAEIRSGTTVLAKYEYARKDMPPASGYGSGCILAKATAAGSAEDYEYSYYTAPPGYDSAQNPTGPYSVPALTKFKQVNGPDGTVQFNLDASTRKVSALSTPSQSWSTTWGSSTRSSATSGTVQSGYGGTAVSLIRSVVTGRSTGLLGPRANQVTETCPANENGKSCFTGTTQYLLYRASATDPTPGPTDKAMPAGFVDKLGIRHYQTPGEVARYSGNTVLKPISSGVSTATETRNLTTYSYDRAGANGTLPPEQNPVLKPTKVRRASVLGGAGDVENATYYWEDVAAPVNRVKEKRTTGYTKGFDDVVQTIAISTYYFYSEISPPPEGLYYTTTNRWVEVHGPCLKESPSAADCSGRFPIEFREYYPPGPCNGAVCNGGQLKAVHHNTGRGAGWALDTDLVTQYDEYDVWGNVTKQTDPNGVVTLMEWDSAHHMTKKTVQASPDRVWTYAYERGELSLIVDPLGYAERICHRVSEDVECTTGDWLPQVKWRAKGKTLSGAFAWTEKVVYTHYSDGRVQTETYSVPEESARRVVRYGYDSDGNMRRVAAGSIAADNMTPVEHGTSFDAVGNVRAVSNSTAAKECISDPKQCTGLAYDAASNLRSVTEYLTSTDGVRTLFKRDSHGNVVGIKRGCGIPNPGSEGTPEQEYANCSSPQLQYLYDDFGRLLRATLPYMSGDLRYEYDAAGNLVREDDPSMRGAVPSQWIGYSYDQRGRVVERRWFWAASPRNTAGDQALVSYEYDLDHRVLKCSGVMCRWVSDGACQATTNTMGRLRRVQDSFGTTWYSYDAAGNLKSEIRLRTGTACAASPSNTTVYTNYAWDVTGVLTGIDYPHGRSVGYVRDPLSGRVKQVTVTKYSGTAWNSAVLVDDVKWEPYSGLRSYKMIGNGVQGAVEHLLGDQAADAPTASCATGRPGAGDLTGRLRGIWISSSASNPSGDVLKRWYRWTGDQVLQQSTCVLSTGSTTPLVEYFGYDWQQRLLQALGGPVNTYAGYLFQSPLRNMTRQADGSRLFAFAYQGENSDVMTSRFSESGGTIQRNYSTDPAGRVWRITSEGDSTGNWGHVVAGSYGLDANNTSARSSVFRALSAGNDAASAWSNYFYDAHGRRWKKVLSNGIETEFFYDLGHQMLEDRTAQDAMTPVNGYTEDDYVWLDGRPVAVVKGRFDSSMVRQTEGAADLCSRNGEVANCGTYFLVNDYLPKPIAMLDDTMRLVNAVDYDPYGTPNRQPLHTETAHPYTNNQNTSLGSCAPQAMAAEKVQTRVKFHLVDTEGPYYDYASLTDGSGSILQTYIGGPHRGQVWSSWVTPAADKIVNIRFRSDASNWSPSGFGFPYTGIVVDSCEYRRFQAGVANPTWVPIRFPGQYYDAETDLVENWNRYYDPSIGRYLQPDPMMQYPMLGSGNAYAYAGNNPIANTDATGLLVELDPSCGPYKDKLGPIFDKIGATGTGGGKASRLGGIIKTPSKYTVKCYPTGDPWCFKTGECSQNACAYTQGNVISIFKNGLTSPGRCRTGGDKCKKDEFGKLVVHELGHIADMGAPREDFADKCGECSKCNGDVSRCR